jgi:hypothetical protein
MTQIDYNIITSYKAILHLCLALGLVPLDPPCHANIMGGIAATLRTGVQCGDTSK